MGTGLTHIFSANRADLKRDVWTLSKHTMLGELQPAIVSETSDGEEQSDGADPLIDHCDLCNKPAWFQKYCKNKKASKCKSMFCGFVRDHAC